MQKWLFVILSRAVAMASPQIIGDIRRLVAEMVARAEATPNPWDDIICGLLQTIVGKPGDSVHENADDKAIS